jgi:hypothetical protein
MSNLFFPSLSEDGWVVSTQQQADYLLADFFASDYSQTQLYLDKVSSAAYVIYKTQGDIIGTKNLLQNTLSDYFSRYFLNVNVDVTEVPNELDLSRVTLAIFLTFIDLDGIFFSLDKVFDIVDGKAVNILSINNG